MPRPSVEPPTTPTSGEITSDKPTQKSDAAAPAQARHDAFEAQRRYMDERFGYGRHRGRLSPD